MSLVTIHAKKTTTTTQRPNLPPSTGDDIGCHNWMHGICMNDCGRKVSLIRSGQLYGYNITNFECCYLESCYNCITDLMHTEFCKQLVRDYIYRTLKPMFRMYGDKNCSSIDHHKNTTLCVEYFKEAIDEEERNTCKKYFNYDYNNQEEQKEHRSITLLLIGILSICFGSLVTCSVLSLFIPDSDINSRKTKI